MSNIWQSAGKRFVFTQTKNKKSNYFKQDATIATCTMPALLTHSSPKKLAAFVLLICLRSWVLVVIRLPIFFRVRPRHRKYEWRANRKSVSYLEQQNCLPAYKKEWVEFAYLHSQALQATVKRVDLAYNAFFQGLRKPPKFKSIRKFSGWITTATSGWKANTSGKHGSVNLNDLGVKIKMRGRALQWGKPTTLTVVYKPGLKQWFASFSVEIPDVVAFFGSQSELAYNSIIAFDLGCETAITTYDGKSIEQISNPRFTQRTEAKIKKASKKLRRKQAPNRNKKIKASRRWNSSNKRVPALRCKAGTQRQDWQHKVTSEIASRYDIGVTEQLNTKGMTRKASKGSKRKKQKAGLNKSILSVGFGTLNKMLTYKISSKGGLIIMLPTKEVKPSQRCRYIFPRLNRTTYCLTATLR